MEQYTTHIKSKTGWFDINFKELFIYRDLIYLFFKRNYVTRYKQTILGPMWLIVNPLITVLLYSFVFGNIAGLSTEGAPQLVFYLCSNSIWIFFANSLNETSKTFTSNAAIMGKVYFPRLVMPISSVLTGMVDMLIQLGMLVVLMLIYFITGTSFEIGISLLLLPLIVFQTGMLGLGFGIIIAALTTKYRDLAVLVSFGVQLWMYASPVVYTASSISEKYYWLYMLNPMAPILTSWRNIILGIGTFPTKYLLISGCITVGVLMLGVVLFSKIEKTFMDTV